MSSSRLPNKVLKPILGEPMLWRQLERVSKVKSIDKIVIATSKDKSDDIIESTFSGSPYQVFRGSLDDVLDRYYCASQKYHADHILRLTGDCPLIDPNVIEQLIEFYLANGFDYVCNTEVPTFPDGQDAWIFKKALLEEAWRESKLPSEREHVTMFFRNNLDKYTTGSFENKIDLSKHRWTVDEPEDFLKVEAIFKSLYPSNKEFTVQDILKFLNDNPDIDQLNESFLRDEGLIKSLKNDF